MPERDTVVEGESVSVAEAVGESVAVRVTETLRERLSESLTYGTVEVCPLFGGKLGA